MAQDKRKKAVALTYDPTNQAPQVVASGQGAVAERIIEKAKEAEEARNKLLQTINKVVASLRKIEI